MKNLKALRPFLAESSQLHWALAATPRAGLFAA
jgi:hypothetical protein